MPGGRTTGRGARVTGERYGPPPRPATAVAAAVLALAQAAVLLLLVLVVVVDVAGLGRSADVGLPALLAIGACTLAGLDLLGGLSLLRGAGRTLLLVTAAVEAGVSGLASVVALAGLVRAGASSSGDALVLLAAVALLALPVVRLVLVSRAEVRAWSRTGRDPVRTGTVAALLGPVAALAATATVVLAITGTDAVFTDDVGGTYSGSGEPVAPPAPGGQDFDGHFADAAGDCYGGEMAACDDLYAQTPVGDPYETYGSTCGGRLDDETYGGCVRVFGPTD
ncbi:hypothetical protein SAMN05444351_0204 [Geodermatophilus nigrescens]|uniref:Uncharacterized protein n=1 Tax=Geodermatophilus nigrescens TaxID=1070870 RepID=A0A1M5D394_9ACTN|nr:hypothetical protein SAMN05444351_0204 [Geodermatophilus nigrescens]